MAAQDGTPVIPLKLTDEERAVLRECRVKSVYFRGLPLGAVSVLLMRELVKFGYVPHGKRFAGFYYSGMFVLGLFAGIGSYRKTCMENIMRLENSKLADQVRDFYKKAGMSSDVVSGAEKSLSGPDEFGDQMTVFEEDTTKKQSFADQETRPELNPSDSGNTSWTLSPLGTHESMPANEKNTTYEDLRKRNRNQWTQPSRASRTQQDEPRREVEPLREVKEYHSSADNYKEDNIFSSWSSDEKPAKTQGIDDEKSTLNRRWQQRNRTGPPTKKNKYGDDME